jgi:hypothetical protein
MLLTKTALVTAAIASGVLATPPAAAAPQRIPEPPPWPAPRVQHCKCTVAPHAAPCQTYERPRRARGSGARAEFARIVRSEGRDATPA